MGPRTRRTLRFNLIDRSLKQVMITARPARVRRSASWISPANNWTEMVYPARHRPVRVHAITKTHA
jgi:hypothetical protein